MPHPRGPVAKPTLMTPVVKSSILAAVAAGLTPSRAARLAGISRATFHYWRAGHERGGCGAHCEFFRSLARAEATCEMAAISKLREGGPDWKRYAWFLERRFPQRWGRSRRPPEPPGPPRPIEQMTAEELDEYKRRLEDHESGLDG